MSNQQNLPPLDSNLAVATSQGQSVQKGVPELNFELCSKGCEYFCIFDESVKISKDLPSLCHYGVLCVEFCAKLKLLHFGKKL